MRVPDHIQRVDNALRRTGELLASGWTERRIARRVREKRLVRIARGWYAPAADWNAWHPSDRQLARVLIAHRDAIRPPLFTHTSAAVLLGLPVWEFPDSRVHLSAETSGASRPSMSRHQQRVAVDDVVSVAGIRCTSADRTLIDLASLACEETLVGVADAVLRSAVEQGGRGSHSFDEVRSDSWRHRMRDRIAGARGRRGVRALRRAIEFADARADSVLESVSRLQFRRLGIDVDLQVRVPNPDGGCWYVDFELCGLGILGESDGDAKYTDQRLMGSRTAAETVLREKKRDNRISGITGKRLIHWGYEDVRTLEAFARMLRSFGVPVPPLVPDRARR